MKARLPLWVMLGSSLTFLASLYLPWAEAHAPKPAGSGSGLASLLDLLTQGAYGPPDGWAPFGQAAGLLALALAVGAVVCVARPHLTDRLPLAGCAVALAMFALLSVWQIRDELLASFAHTHVAVDVAYGGYLGLASAAIASCSGVALRRVGLARGDATTLAATALSVGLFAALLVPELTYHVLHIGTWTGYMALPFNNLEVFITGLACFGLLCWTRAAQQRARLAVSVAISVLTAGYLSGFTTYYWPWELWLLLGCSVGLLALALWTSRGVRFSRLSLAGVATLVAALLLLVSLFLPWQRVDSLNGWLAGGIFPGGLVLIALVTLFGFGRLPVELIVGAAIYVSAAGFSITEFGRLAYGAPVGFAGTALLLFPAAGRLRDIPLGLERLIRLIPALACAAFLAVPIAAPYEFTSPLASPWRLGWLGLAAILVALRLLGRWIAGPRAAAERLLLPLLLLMLTGLDLIYIRDQWISWEGWSSLALCLVLALLGWIEVRGSGLESFSDIWRVDRISTVED